MKTKVFPLSHLVLYAKNWYKRSDNIWNDLLEILKLDNYSPFTHSDVYVIILSRFNEFEHRGSTLPEVLRSIHPDSCWKVGYYTNKADWVKGHGEFPAYDMPTAFIYHVLSTLAFIDNEQWKPVTPKYKMYPKNPNISTKSVIEMFSKLKT